MATDIGREGDGQRGSAGRLVLVGTPIGNLDDLSPRAAAALGSADVVACEDTRRTGRLLAHLGLSAPSLWVVNDHTEADVVPGVLARLGAGQTVALVSDAGMPAVSDPGERLVAAVVDAGFTVKVVPGPSAVLAGLVVSGLAVGRFVFEGFVPRKGSARTSRLAELGAERRTVVLYEAPHRLERTLEDLVGVCGADRRVVLARELTKLYEQVWRGTLGEAVEFVNEVPPRGEYVLVLEGAPEPAEVTDDEICRALAERVSAGLSRRDAVAEVAAAYMVARRRVYTLATGQG